MRAFIVYCHPSEDSFTKIKKQPATHTYAYAANPEKIKKNNNIQSIQNGCVQMHTAVYHR